MKYTSNYTDIGLAFLILFIGVFIQLILFFEYDLGIYFVCFYYSFFLATFYFVVKNRMYLVVLKNDSITQKYLNGKIKVFSVESIEKFSITIVTRGTPNITITFNHNGKKDKLQFSSSDSNDLKMIYNYYTRKGVKVEIIPIERTNHFTNG